MLINKFRYINIVKFSILHQIFFVSLLINFVTLDVIAQKDTIYTEDKSLQTIGKYSARDSIFNDLKNKKVHLFGDAKLEYNDIKLSAYYIVFDMENEEVYATYQLTSDKTRVGEPLIIQNGEEFRAGTIRFNLKTKKGYIQEAAIKQDEIYLQMEVAKRHPNDEVHFRDGMFTTCDLRDPHFHFHLSKAVLIPNKKIVSKKMNVYLRDISLPLGLPFLVIPQSKPKDIKKGKSGILVPKFAPTSIFGMGISDLGYYLPINDSLHTTFLANIYTSGSWLLSNNTEYKVKYKFNGRLNLLYQQNYQSFPHKKLGEKFSLIWQHSKDSKSNPYWNFSSNVNFVSDNNNKNTVNPINPNYLSNTMKSDINITRSFPNKPMTLGIKISSSQNSITKMMDVTSPILTFNITRFAPTKVLFKNRIGGDRWFDKINMSYGFEGKNISTFADSLIRTKDFSAIKNKFINGFKQNITITSTMKVLKNTWSITPTINYSNYYDFQQTNKQFDSITNKLINQTLQKQGVFYDVNFSIRATSQVYTYYRFLGKKKPLLRHILTPSFGYTYIPKNQVHQSFYSDINNKAISYSVFENSLYRQSSTNAASLFTFDLMNTLELKTKSSKDTVTGFKKTKIIDAFSINGSYNFLADSMKLTNLNLSLRFSPWTFISVVASSTFSPYSWDPITGKTKKEYAIQSHQSLGRLLSSSINTTWTLTTKEGKRKLAENKDAFTTKYNSDIQYYSMFPERFLDFTIPWKMNFTHIFTVQTNTNKTIINSTNFSTIQTLSINGDISFTKRWKVSGTAYFDIKTNKITNCNFTLTRNLHCWNLSFWVTPIGTNKSFLLRLFSNATLLQDAKLELRKPPSVF